MAEAVTLRQLTGQPDAPSSLSDSTLVMIDIQNTYTRGLLELDGVEPAIDAAAELLDRARSAGTPVVHIMHDAGEGTPYDVRAEIGQIVTRVAPRDGEPVIVKNYPNSFVATDLDAQLRALGRPNVILTGFMAHMCVRSTADGAFSHGYAPTVVASATATRTLPDLGGVAPDTLKQASLAAIGDLFAVIAPDVASIPD